MGACQPNDVIRVAAKQYGPNEQQVVNVFWWQLSAPTAVDDISVMTAVASRLDDMYNAIKAYVANDQQADEIDFYNKTQDRPMGATGWPTYTGGEAVGEYLPVGCAALLSGNTAEKKVLPKKFLGCLTEGGVADGEWVSLLMDALAIFAGYWWESISVGLDALLQSGTWSKRLLRFVKIITITAKSLSSYQRRRKPTIGR